MALAVYPDANVEVVRGGLKLLNSRPAVPEMGAKVLTS